MKDSDFDFDDCIGIAYRPAKDGFVRDRVRVRNSRLKSISLLFRMT